MSLRGSRLAVVVLLVAAALPRAASAPDMLPPAAPSPLGLALGLGLPLPGVPLEDADQGRRPSCEEARLKCAYRTGCGRALQMYIVGCSALHHGPPGHCPEACQQALIALTSTDEGKDLMTCQCADDLCEETKRRVEVCRPSVLRATRNESVVSCRVAQWICGADALCSTALEYYHRYCRRMFRGQKCTARCKNSISILRRQDKAAKLDSCWCDGKEEYDCPAIRSNMAQLCFHQAPPRTYAPPDPLPGDVETNELLPKQQSKGGAARARLGAPLLLLVLAAALAAAS
ncbi:growth arrest-specific protein 1-like [Frankliniella occidentalis]|uniref:Growth arrest-specific protein 1-like n=1 Tax=Frankliniella occidentalis TaxID=133901 RepID=A0A6J1T4E8_FRAOC|nr:growth arrest-specific protein 1-like [Frankliniella occidentalis]